MSIVKLQCFRMRCEPRYITMKSETSAKHPGRISKKTPLYSGKHDKKINNIRKYNENINSSSILQKLF